MSKKGLFLDRDGIINIDKGYIHKVKDVEFVEGIFELCKKMQSEGYLIFVVTNQAGIDRGMYKPSDVDTLHAFMAEEFKKHGITVTKFRFCPHHPEFSGPCSCRKPEPGMIVKNIEEFDIDPGESIMIGDKPSDTQAGKNAGVKTCILVRSGYFDDPEPTADHTVDEVSDIIKIL